MKPTEQRESLYKDLGLEEPGELNKNLNIGNAYKEALLNYHPDKNLGVNQETTESKNEKFRRAHDAGKILKIPYLKKIYDIYLAGDMHVDGLKMIGDIRKIFNDNELNTQPKEYKHIFDAYESLAKRAVERAKREAEINLKEIKFSKTRLGVLSKIINKLTGIHDLGILRGISDSLDILTKAGGSFLKKRPQTPHPVKSRKIKTLAIAKG